MKWEPRAVGLPEFMELVTNGHSYCNVFEGNQRKDTMFQEAWQISIDMDDADISMADFLVVCPLDPTAAYGTFSNKPEQGEYNYRFVYFLDTPVTDKLMYQLVYNRIVELMGMSGRMNDDCGRKPSQLMNGTTGDAETYMSGHVYSLEELGIDQDYIDEHIYSPVLISDEMPLAAFGTGAKNSVSHTTRTRKPAAYETENAILDILVPEDVRNALSYTDDAFLAGKAPVSHSGGIRHYRKAYNNIKCKTAPKPTKQEFYFYWKKLIDSLEDAITDEIWLKETAKEYGYKPIMHSELKWNPMGFAEIPDDFVELAVLWDNTEWGKRTVKRFTDGMHRRQNIFIDAIKLLHIKPKMSRHELFWQLIWRREHYYDNSDNVLSNKMIARKAYDALNCPAKHRYHTSKSEGFFSKKKAGSVTTSDAFCRMMGTTRRSQSRTSLQVNNYMKNIEPYYNPEMSVVWNYKMLNSHGVKVSLGTLRNYCEFMGIDTNPKKTNIADWYNPGISVKKNLEWAKERGIKISSSRLYEFCKEHGYST